MVRRLSRREFVTSAAAATAAVSLPCGGAVAQAPVLRRSDARSPEGKQMLQLYRIGVARMMAKPGWDPTSWIFWANIHAIPDEESTDDALDALFRPSSNSPAERVRVERAWDLAAGVEGSPGEPQIWVTCPHSSSDEAANDFLSWHRLYIWCFERIVEAAVGQPFRLPYWDFNRDGSLPVEFVEPVNGSQRGNPLFRPDRKSWINAFPNPQPMRGSNFSPANALAQPRLAYQSDNRPGFSLMLEQAPHNNVHTAIGTADREGNPIGMAVITTAARDPIFWLHHVNIDRLWESWRLADQNGDSRRDPTGNWRTQRHHFVSPDSRRVVLPTEFALRTRRNLGYEYDRLEILSTGPVSLNEAMQQTTREFNAGNVPPDVAGGAVAATGGGFSVGEDGGSVELDKKGLPRSRDFTTGPPKRTFLRLGGISGAQPATNFSVFLNQAPSGVPRRDILLGSFSLFGLASRPASPRLAKQHQHGVEKIDRIIDITEAVAANPDIVFGTGKLDIRVVPDEKNFSKGFQVESVSVFQE